MQFTATIAKGLPAAFLCLIAGFRLDPANASDRVLLKSSASTVIGSVAGHGSLPMGDGKEFREHMLSWATPESLATMRTESMIGNVAISSWLISSPFGWRRDPIKGIRRKHDGIDLPGKAGAHIYATGVGFVSFSGWRNGYGNLVQIDHPGGVSTRYAHLSHISVFTGSSVRQGDIIGQMGSTGRSTGSHLHYEVRVDGVPVNPMNFIGQTSSSHETAWAVEPAATPRWAGWDSIEAQDSLPVATIR